MANHFRCVIHGSFSKHFADIKATREIFTTAGITVMAPKAGELTSENDGFALFADEKDKDPRLVELEYLHNLKKLGKRGFSYFVNPKGYLGSSASYELGIAQLTSTPCFFMHKLADHPAYVHNRSVWSAATLAEHITLHQALPSPQVKQNEKQIHKLWQELVAPGVVVATGAIIEHQSWYKEKEILLVKTHKWGNRYSIVGGKVRQNERLQQTLLREVREETNLRGEVGKHICTFDQIKNSGYYQASVQHIFVDNVVKVRSKKVGLNEEAQDYVWALPSEALQHLDIEPNARTTVELYAKQTA